MREKFADWISTQAVSMSGSSKPETLYTQQVHIAVQREPQVGKNDMPELGNEKLDLNKCWECTANQRSGGWCEGHGGP